MGRAQQELWRLREQRAALAWRALAAGALLRGGLAGPRPGAALEEEARFSTPAVPESKAGKACEAPRRDWAQQPPLTPRLHAGAPQPMLDSGRPEREPARRPPHLATPPTPPTPESESESSPSAPAPNLLPAADAARPAAGADRRRPTPLAVPRTSCESPAAVEGLPPHGPRGSSETVLRQIEALLLSRRGGGAGCGASPASSGDSSGVVFGTSPGGASGGPATPDGLAPLPLPLSPECEAGAEGAERSPSPDLPGASHPVGAIDASGGRGTRRLGAVRDAAVQLSGAFATVAEMVAAASPAPAAARSFAIAAPAARAPASPELPSTPARGPQNADAASPASCLAHTAPAVPAWPMASSLLESPVAIPLGWGGGWPTAPPAPLSPGLGPAALAAQAAEAAEHGALPWGVPAAGSAATAAPAPVQEPPPPHAAASGVPPAGAQHLRRTQLLAQAGLLPRDLAELAPRDTPQGEGPSHNRRYDGQAQPSAPASEASGAMPIRRLAYDDARVRFPPLTSAPISRYITCDVFLAAPSAQRAGRPSLPPDASQGPTPERRNAPLPGRRGVSAGHARPGAQSPYLERSGRSLLRFPTRKVPEGGNRLSGALADNAETSALSYGELLLSLSSRKKRRQPLMSVCLPASTFTGGSTVASRAAVLANAAATRPTSGPPHRPVWKHKF